MVLLGYDSFLKKSKSFSICFLKNKVKKASTTKSHILSKMCYRLLVMKKKGFLWGGVRVAGSLSKYVDQLG